MRATVYKLGTQTVKHQGTAALKNSYCKFVPIRKSIPCLTTYSSLQSRLRSQRETVAYQVVRRISSEQKARDLNQQGIDEQEASLDDSLSEEKEKQIRTPWHREGVDESPVRRQRSAGAMTKG